MDDLSVIGLLMLFVVTLIFCLLGVSGEKKDDADDYCYMCPHGWCMEIPKTKGCLKYQEEKKKEEGEQDAGIDQG